MPDERTGQRWIRTQLEGPATVLLLASPQMVDSPRYCQDLVTTAAPIRESVLVISCSGSPQTWLRDWKSQLPYVPTNLEIIEVLTEHQPSSDQELIVLTSDDLSTLESRISKFLRQTHESGTQSILLFDSLSALFASAEKDACQEFINRVVDESRIFKAFAFFHLDPADKVTRKSIEETFDSTAKLLPKERKWEIH